jgi:hypothetical protein
MDSDDSAPREMLWLEGLRSFGRHKGPVMQRGLIFMVILAAILFVFLYQFNQFAATLPDPPYKERGELLKFLLPALPVAIFWFVLFEFVLSIQYFVFTAYFAEHDMHMGAPVLGVGRFFYALLQMILLVLIFVGIGAAMGLVFAFLKHTDPESSKIPVLVLRAALNVAVVYLQIRFSFVYTLAVAALKPVFKNSWRLTHNNWWRLFWNKIVLAIIMMIIMLVLGAVFFAGWYALKLAQLEKSVLPVAQNVMIVAGMSVGITLLTAILSAYLCAACRIIAGEKLRADPSFPLADA